MLSSTQANILNKGIDVEMQRVQLGTEVRNAQVNGMIVVPVSIEADATGGYSFTIPEAMVLVDVIVQARATSGSGTAKLRTATTDITNAIVMATDTNITRCGTIDDSKASFTAGQSLNIITNGANDRGLVTLVGYRV